MASVKICISIWFVDCLANRYLWRAFHCCLFAQIVNETLGTKLLSMFQVKAISVSRHHRKSSSFFAISFCAQILILARMSHVPLFWQWLLVLLAHSSMSANKTQAWTFFAWFSFCILKRLLVTFYIFKRTVLPRYPKQLSVLTNHFR